MLTSLIRYLGLGGSPKKARYPVQPSITLPDLPVEIQSAILSNIPPNQLFTLRRVSHAWSVMLSNPALLEAINTTIPFLTTAHDFTDRVKRRMRIARGEPLWVKPFNEAFPWAVKYDDTQLTHWKRYSEGWMVFLTGPLRRTSNSEPPLPDLINPHDSFKLIIGGLYVDGIEVPILPVLNEVNPELCQEWLGEKLGQNRNAGFTDIEAFHFHLEDGMAVVGLWARKHGKVSDIYFFIFSLDSRQLLRHIHIPATHETLEDEIFPRLNNTHFLTVCGERTLEHPHNPQASKIYKINIHPIVPTPGQDSQAPEIVIAVPDYVTEAIRDTAVAFDHLGRVWFPFSNTAIVSSTIMPYHSIYMRELPRSECGRWVILDPTEVLMKLQSFVSTYSDEIPVSPAPELLEGKVGLCRYKRSLHVLDFIPPPNRVHAPQLIRIREVMPELPAHSSKEITRGIPEELRKGHQGVSVLGWYHSSAMQATWPWGYIMRPTFDEGENVYLLPLREGDGESSLRLKTNLKWHAAEAAGWKRVGNGVPADSSRGRLIRTERDSWGDDGVMSWKMTYLNDGREESMSWVVCYEEDWRTL